MRVLGFPSCNWGDPAHDRHDRAHFFISLFLAVAQERSQFIDRLALQPARIQIPAYVCAFIVLELFPRDRPGAVCLFSVFEMPPFELRNWPKGENGPDWARTSDPALIKRML